MKKSEIIKINEMRLQGKSTTEIAVVLDISANTIRSYIRRHPEAFGCKPCRNCGKLFCQPFRRKEKLFCSDKCRMAWWNSHREQVRKKTYYTITCNYCGKEFESYANKDRKFCCRDCYFRSRSNSPENDRALSGIPGSAEHHAT